MKVNKKEKKKIQKGDFGYFSAEKKRLLGLTAILFAVPLFIFFTAWAYNGSRLTIWTVIVVVCCLPACRYLVNLIMVFLRHPMDEELYKKIRRHQGELTMSYEMYMTFYEKSAYIDAFAICGNTVVGYSSDPKIDTDFMASEAQKIIRKNGYKADVKILKELKPFLERLDSMNEHKASLEEGIRFSSDDRYPGLSRNEVIKKTILAICL